LKLIMKKTLTLSKHLIVHAAVSGLACLQAQEAPEPVHELAPYSVVTTMRTTKSLSTVPQTVSLIDADLWDTQSAFSLDPVAALSQLVPSFSPSRQKMTGFGETFRGRSPLFLVDGVPQSNPLRDGSRDGFTIDAAMIERVEVIHGASAAQGLGATGGIINFITIAPPAEDGMRNSFVVGSEFSDELKSETSGYYADLASRYREGRFGYAASVSYKWRPMAVDGDGNLIGIDNTQGDTMNSRSLDLFEKVQYDLTDEQQLELMVNSFELEQDMEYVSVNGDPETGLPTTSIKGETPGKATTNDVTSAQLSYTHSAFLGGLLKANLFYQDFAATYGGGTFGVFEFNGERIFDQSQNESEKQGLKLTFVRDILDPIDVGLVAGIDFIEDETRQILVQTGRTWVPETSYESVAPYIQLEKVLGKVVLSGGLRYEDASLNVGDFTTLEAYGSQEVEGGSPGFSELLANIGLTWELTPGLTAFASFNEGFGMPDVGRVLRGINQPGQSVSSFLDLQPIVTDNYEIGLRKSGNGFTGSVSLFFSDSDLGSRLSADADGIFSVNREKTETFGIELSGRYTLTEADTLDARFALVDGKFDSDDDGDTDTRLDGTNIPPARLNLGWSRVWTETVSTRLQSSTYFDRDAPAGPANDFDGYTLLDLLVSWKVGGGRLDLGISNLLDKQYITYYAQTSPAAGRYFAGRGRTLNLRFSRDF
jgi:iron complex outermembrane receptor protein